MGQKVNPIGLRLRINRTWISNWFVRKDFAVLLEGDIKIRNYISKKLKNLKVSKVVIERPSAKGLTVILHVARAGLLINNNNKKFSLDTLKKDISKLSSYDARINVVEIKKPEIDSQLVADNIAGQLEKRISFRRAMKKAVAAALKSGAQGIRVNCSGRLGGAEIARMEWYREGRVPLHTLRSDIDYAEASAFTTYGVCGVKVWIFKGEVLNKYNWLQEKSFVKLK